MRTARRKSKFAVQEDADPLSVVVNLFDVAMVFAVALMVAMVREIKSINIRLRTNKAPARKEKGLV